MSDAAGKLTDALHLLCLQQALFGRQPLLTLVP